MRIVVAMSGGVDSSAAACLLKEQGHEVIGLFMRNGAHAEREGGKGCCTLADAHDAQAVASHLDFPFYAINFEEQFGQLIDYFVEEYLRGRTPNPCIMCNRDLKFGHLLDFAREFDADAVATGHYARLESRDGRRVIRRGIDKDKDQSYVLFNLTQQQLARVEFPIGHLNKDQVRELARRVGLRVHDKHESQDICFVPDGDYRKILREHSPGRSSPGSIVDEGGRVVGEHEGLEFYTVGQRRGLGVALGSPRYVTKLDTTTNTVHIGPDDQLFSEEFTVDRVNWVSGPELAAPEHCDVQIRYTPVSSPATVEPLEDDRARVTFDGPQRAITPGQAAVFYREDEILGGGWIE